MSAKPVRALEFYSGIGGLNLALRRSLTDGYVVQAFDWDQAACKVYGTNHGPPPSKVDISTLKASDISSFRADLWLLSPSCQPYTVLNISPQDDADPRAKSFLHLMQNVLPDLVSTEQHPTHLLIENVGGFETSSTRKLLLRTLASLGYTTFELLLNPLQFSIPNSRLRYYLLAKKDPLKFPSAVEGRVWRHIPGKGEDWVDLRSSEQSEDVESLSHYLDEVDGAVDVPIPDRVLQKWGRLFDIVSPSSRRSCCFTRGYTQLVERSGSILQMNEALDTTAVFNAFSKAQEDGDGQAVRLLDPLHLRYFTPSELLRLFHFDISRYNSDPEFFVWPEGISTKTKYRLIGNSVNVQVVEALINFLYDFPERLNLHN